MLFNSIDFAIFLPVVFILYWLLNKNLRLQNLLLLIASYFFYACWDYRFLALILFSTGVDYLFGIKISKTENKTTKKLWVWISVITGIGVLCFFKYYNFFAGSFIQALSLMGIRANYGLVQVILPLGISFYTFHGLSYILDIYKGKIKPERNFIDYGVFVSFFPLLVAGPIERATHLLPQIKQQRQFNYLKSVDGLRQILWGLFKKVVIADNCAGYANMIFAHPGNYQGSTLLLGVFFFAIQIYCDFSGYSDIAIGTARLFGIDLLRNFSFPYFSRSVPEFWRRWHISLTSWFRDYLYIPLGGSRVAKARKILNTFIIFLVSGFWHGANWTFILWGFLHGLYMLPSIIWGNNKKHTEIVAQGKFLPSFKELLAMLFTFFLVLVAWVFFRAGSISQAFIFLSDMFSPSLFSLPETRPLFLIVLILIFIFAEWLGREQQFAIQTMGFRWYKPVRWSFYLLLSIIIFINLGKEQAFIYFQF